MEYRKSRPSAPQPQILIGIGNRSHLPKHICFYFVQRLGIHIVVEQSLVGPYPKFPSSSLQAALMTAF